MPAAAKHFGLAQLGAGQANSPGLDQPARDVGRTCGIWHAAARRRRAAGKRSQPGTVRLQRIEIEHQRRSIEIVFGRAECGNHQRIAMRAPVAERTISAVMITGPAVVARPERGNIPPCPAISCPARTWRPSALGKLLARGRGNRPQLAARRCAWLTQLQRDILLALIRGAASLRRFAHLLNLRRPATAAGRSSRRQSSARSAAGHGSSNERRLDRSCHGGRKWRTRSPCRIWCMSCPAARCP